MAQTTELKQDSKSIFLGIGILKNSKLPIISARIMCICNNKKHVITSTTNKNRKGTT